MFTNLFPNMRTEEHCGHFLVGGPGLSSTSPHCSRMHANNNNIITEYVHKNLLPALKCDVALMQ